MTSWQSRARFPLWLRIWIAVVGAVAVLTIVFGWLWRLSNEQVPEREVIIRNETGEIIGQDETRPIRDPRKGLEFNVEMTDGSKRVVQLPPRRRSPGEPPPGMSWMRGPGGRLWILAIVAIAVVVGAYPIIRRLTLREEELRRGVERWGEGDLSERLNESGS